MIRKQGIEDDDIEGILEKNFTDWDAMRADGLNDLLIFGLSKAEADEQNFEHLQRKYGANHPLALEAQARAEAGKIFAAELSREIVRTETPQPVESTDLWTIYGYVFNEKNEAVENAPIRIFDEEGEPILRTETTKTDGRGHFQLRIKIVKNLPETVRVGVPPDSMSEDVFAPAAGETDYAEIVVTGKIKDMPPDKESSGKLPPESSGASVQHLKMLSDWLITGKITDAKGIGIANLKVRVFDKDIIRDDALGETKTNADGVYRLAFTQKQFSDLGENYPELYLIVEDETGNRLFDGRREAKTKAGHIELIDVRLEGFTGKTGKLK